MRLAAPNDGFIAGAPRRPLLFTNFPLFCVYKSPGLILFYLERIICYANVIGSLRCLSRGSDHGCHAQSGRDEERIMNTALVKNQWQRRVSSGSLQKKKKKLLV